MASENQVTIVGNITDDPELRYTPSGTAVANFTVAVNRRFRSQEGQWEDKLEGFFRCSCWRDMAENVADSFKKGTRVIVVGRLQQRSWETNEGQKRYEIEIQVDEAGPSLRWAQAQVQKSERSGGGSRSEGGGGFGQSQQGGYATPGSQPAGQPAQQQQPAQKSGDDWGATSGVAPADEGGF